MDLLLVLVTVHLQNVTFLSSAHSGALSQGINIRARIVLLPIDLINDPYIYLQTFKTVPRQSR